MGYIDSNSRIWSIQLTRLGRQYLANDSDKFSIDRVSFSDEEVNYNLVESTDVYDSKVIEMPVLEPSSNVWADFSSSLIHNAYSEDQNTDTVPDFDYKIGAEFYGSNIFKLDNTIDDQFLDISYFILYPNTSVAQDSWFLPHSSYVDMTRFLRYNCFVFDLEPTYPAKSVGEGLTASPYWYTWLHKDALRQTVTQEFSVDNPNWEPDNDAINVSRWICSDDRIGTNFVPLTEYRSFNDNRKNGVTFRLKIKKEYLPRLFSYMAEFGTETIKDYIYIVNNDPLIVPETYVYGRMKYDYINKRIPIFITKVI